ncbi:transketolase C-terminal domain-containing protein [Arcanobacterium hippocoleae]
MGKAQLQNAGNPGKFAYDALHGLKRGVKDVLFDAGIFDSLGLKYLGPVNGHNILQLTEALKMAKKYGGPVVVHAITEKGRGYRPAEENKEDHFHAVGIIHPETGLPVVQSRFGWTKVFADEIVKLARKDDRIIGITAAMMYPVGLEPMYREFPRRVIDAGIAEQHAMTMAAGLAHAGYRPVLALYATFMNRAFDQLLMDVALHREPVTICLDRSGITGDDGASHNGMWDLAIAAMIPGLHTAVPRDGTRLRELLAQSIALAAPALIRYPKGAVPADLPQLSRFGDVDILYRSSDTIEDTVLVIAIGAMAHNAVAAAKSLIPQCPVTVVDPRWALPISNDLLVIAQKAKAVVTVEDGITDGGIGSEIALKLCRSGSDTPITCLGIRKEFLKHDTRNNILQQQQLDPESIAAAIQAAAVRRNNAL